ncbi:hypothetical protein D3C80_1772920 [compost metagenome]
MSCIKPKPAVLVLLQPGAEVLPGILTADRIMDTIISSLDEVETEPEGSETRSLPALVFGTQPAILIEGE